MRVRNILPLVVFCIVAVTAFGQTKGIAGKWGTDGASARRATSMTFDLRVDNRGRVSGSVTEYGTAICGSPDASLPIDDGIVQGNVVTIVTTLPNPCPAAGTPIAPLGPGTVVTWTGTLGNDDSLSFTRANSGVRGGAPNAPAPQNPPATASSRNPVSGSRNPVQGMTTPPVQGMTTPPILQQGRGIAAPASGGGGRGGGVLVMHRQ